MIASTAALAGACAVGAPVASATAAGKASTIQVWMAGHQQAAQRFVDAVSTPGSPTYHQYLSPSAYSQRFGPSAARVKAVQSYLAGAGFTRVHASVNDDYVSATAPASRINRAFSVRARAHVPASIGDDTLAVTGLTGAQPPADGTATASASRRASAPALDCSRYWGQKTKPIRPAFHGVTRAAVAVCGYSAKQIRGAYGLGSATNGHTGAGETIALIAIGAPRNMRTTLTDYAKANGLRPPRAHQYRQEALGRGRRNCASGAAPQEAALDSEAAYAMAPGANQLMIDGDDCDGKDGGDQALFDAELAPLTGHGSRASAAIESVSYGLGDEKDVSSSLRRTSHAIALRAAAEGVSLLFSSGDSHGAQLQASDPDVTAVGGTTLGIGAHDHRVFETGWSDGTGRKKRNRGPWRYGGISYAGGGGASVLYGRPGYQRGIVPSSMARDSAGHLERTVPDIAADADFTSGMLCGIVGATSGKKTTRYEPFLCYGTSQATPLVAGMVADAEQGQPRDLGFLNPLLYSLAKSRAFRDILPVSSSDPQIDRAAYSTFSILTRQPIAPTVSVFDDQDPVHTDQVTAPGYDTMTGLGAPNGLAFIEDLRSGT